MRLPSAWTATESPARISPLAAELLIMKWIYWFGWMAFGAAFRTLFGMRVIGGENLITEGPVLVASNHQSFLDPPLIGNLYKTEMAYLARKTLFKGIGKWLYTKWNAIPVDQDRPDMASLKTIIRKLKEGERVLVFPEGERSLSGEIGDAAPGIGLVAVKSGAVIQPVRISGARDALPRGSSRIRFARITVSVGPPIRLTPEELQAPRARTTTSASPNASWPPSRRSSGCCEATTAAHVGLPSDDGRPRVGSGPRSMAPIYAKVYKLSATDKCIKIGRPTHLLANCLK